MDILFFIGCSLFIAAPMIAMIVRPLKRALLLVVVLLVVGLLFNLSFSLIQISALPTIFPLFTILPNVDSFFRVDGLALFFLLVITTVAIPTVISTYTYLQPFLFKNISVRAFLIFFSLLLLSTQLLVLANHAIAFLIFWELMTLMAYLGMLLNKEEINVQKGSFIYFVTTHAATFSLYIFFFILHQHAESWLFSDFHFTSDNGLLFYVACFFGFIGFAIKAGFMPFHFWLPWAHPIAPTVLSAFFSSILIKTGIYGIFRMIEFCSPLPAWMGIVMLVISLFSAIFGVWYALVQHDIKKLLAYHSIENIGIIGIGIGLGMLGISFSIQSLIWLGFGGALFHTFNHAIFKSLLFIGSGIIYHNFHTRDIEKLGGIVHKAPLFVALFLIGSIAISGIPPLNGFMSEFLIYKGFFESASALGNYFPLLMLLMSVGLAFVGGLALACFTKINSVMFLGTTRKGDHTFFVSVSDYVALGMLAGVCIVFGVYPQSILGIISSVISYNRWGILIQPYAMFAQWDVMTLVFASVLFTIAAVFVWKKTSTKFRISPAWACGYPNQIPRMQYTASSYADEINNIASTLLHREKHVTLPTTIFPAASRFHSHAEDFSDVQFVKPFYAYILKKISSVEFLSHTDIRFYILFMLMVVLLYGGIAIVWTYF
ncbi:MAG: proton-conducting transporter membrane subunit [Bacteroidota bacterium]